MGLFDRLKGFTDPPAPPIRDDSEVPPWLEDAMQPAPQAASNPPPPGVTLQTSGSSVDPYRRAPARGSGSRLITRSSPAPAAPPGPVDMSSARAFSPPPAEPPASEYTPPATVYTPRPDPPPSSPEPPASEYTPPATVYTPRPQSPPPSPSPSPPAAASPQPAAPSPAPAQPPPAQRPWFEKTLPPEQQGGPVPWFARPQGGPAPPAPAPPAYTPAPPQAYTPPPTPAYTPPSPPAPPAYTPPASPAYTPPASQPPAPPRPSTPPAQQSPGELVDRLVTLVVESWRTYPLEPETLSMLQLGLPYLTQRDCSKDAILAGQTAARLGYIARAAEYSEYEPARRGDEDLAQELLESLEAAGEDASIATGIAEFAADLAISEPIDPPASERGPTWSLPGIEGSLRMRLREHLLKGVSSPADVTREDLQQTWKYGYFMRCMEEFFFDE